MRVTVRQFCPDPIDRSLVTRSSASKETESKLRRGGAIICLALLMLLAGCDHRVVATNGETTVNVYASKEQFDKVKSMKSEGGAAGFLGGLGESMLAKKIDNNTPVKVLSSDDEGATIEVLDGAQKGVQGYVARENLN